MKIKNNFQVWSFACNQRCYPSTAMHLDEIRFSIMCVQMAKIGMSKPKISAIKPLVIEAQRGVTNAL